MDRWMPFAPHFVGICYSRILYNAANEPFLHIQGGDDGYVDAIENPYTTVQLKLSTKLRCDHVEALEMSMKS
ncbi:hypothetical protein CHS0354_024937 [Potamilus streckersoni]|uniref:Uncharacterized protein n=1 Tax=Potamilus streckersoni TaxID=2493646 RepID=A0AAE0S4P2_9BIVA|nr:hypothetical protein CHS0354_024937 [Potamilus streckersoni]